MKPVVGLIAVFAAVGGCAGPGSDAPHAASEIVQPMRDEARASADLVVPIRAAETGSDRVVARVNGAPITMAELEKPLMEAYGLRVLVFQMQLTLARQQATQQKIEVTPQDIHSELNRTLKAAFQGAETAKDEDYPALLQQFLDRTGMSRPEFDMVVQTNAILRKIAAPQLKGRITEENVKEAFNTVYGQTVVIRHIQCANPQEALRVPDRIAAGEKFEDIARTMSRNPRTAPLGGELPPFSRQTVTWGPGLGKIPENFKGWAFSAKVGEISPPVEGDGAYHVLKLEKKMEPKAVKYEDVKDSLRADLEERLSEEAVKDLRGKLAKLAQSSMLIEDPVLRQQYELRKAQAEKAIKDEKRFREDMNNAATRAATQKSPATQKSGAGPAPANPDGTPPPANSGKASPDNVPTGERPPATKSAGSADKK